MTIQSTPLARLTVGLLQGGALWFLQRALDAKSWPATDGLLFAPLLAVAMFVPIAVLLGLGNLRPRTLAMWTVVATALCVGLATYDIFRDPTGGTAVDRIAPSPKLWFALGTILFASHSLVESGEADRKLVASYARYFDVSWKLAVQLVLAAGFIGVFWAVLLLGAELFRLIEIEFLTELIKRPWFSIPVTTLVFAYAIHLTDVRAGLVRGTRTLSLTLLSWLLPVLTLLTVAFLLALPFTGLEPLWSTRRATFILLTAAVTLVFLINDAYQDGGPERQVTAVVRYSGTIAAFTLVPLVALAAYGLSLRVDQYGWTPDRIIVLACIVVATCYALGYALAAVLRGPWLRSIELTNIIAAVVMLAALLALTTPIADPARLSVADQVARLESNKTSIDQFDFAFLRFESGRYGEQALERLKTKREGPDARISKKANEALGWRNRGEIPQKFAQPATPSSRIANITVLSSSPRTLPDGFVQQNWDAMTRPFLLPRCLTTNAKCEAILVDLDGDGAPEVLLLTAPTGPAAAFKLAADGKWLFLGSVANAHCVGVRDALRAGKFETAAPLLKELDVAGQRVRIDSECSPASQ
jgi:Domain of unknown function (DUF4153)